MKFLTQSVLALSLLAGAAVPSFAEDATANGTMDASKCSTTEQGSSAAPDANCLNAQDKKSGNPGGDSTNTNGNTNQGTDTNGGQAGGTDANGNSTGNAGDNNSGTGTGNGTGSNGGTSN